MAETSVALVSGGAGGIGGAICAGLARAGHRVAMADLPGERLAAQAVALGAEPFELDVTSAAGTAAAVAAVSARLGPVSVLVSCAGWDELKRFVETDEAFQHKVLEINLAGPMRLVRAVLPGMLERKRGRIVTIASDAGRVGSSLEAIYSGAKGGLIAFTKTIAREAARAGVTANAVCPGPTETPLLQTIAGAGGDAARVIESMTRNVPLKRLGQPADVAAAVVFLCSTEAGYITGQTLSVSGGLTMI